MLQNFGIVVRRFRENLGVSQEEFAMRAGIHRTYIGAIERGERNFTFFNLIKMSQAMDMSLEEVIRQVENSI